MSHSIVPTTTYLQKLQADTARRMQTSVPVPSRFAGAPEELVSVVEAHVEALAKDLRDVVHSLHADPETAFLEHRSAAYLVELLGRHGIAAQLGVHGVDTAIRAEIGSGDGPAIAILSEYDALPDVGHGCGHNVIAAAGVGAFLALANTLIENPNAFTGRVVLLGTPAEEGFSGKEVMARHGAFDGLDAAIMVHPYGYDLADQVWLGRRVLTVTFTGVAAHASAQPFMGRNALDAATLAYQAVGLLRQQLPPVDRVHAVISEGGTRPSIIPERAVLEFYARSKFAETLKDLSERLNGIARGAALMTGTSVEVDWDEHAPTLPVRTNDALTERWVAAQQRRGRQPLPLGVVSETIAASTDFGNVSHRIPGIHPLIKIAAPDVALHTREFAAASATDAAELGALDGACGLALTALDFLCDAELRRSVAEEFAEQGGAIDVPHFFD
ncbi:MULTISPECIES: M20 family metallopeptidase [Cryobacterium]|uniref:Peptidase M20 domain-containing protein 2 n=1 Tax=Cryobacterium levicorallinum TaxID=995038 RepID=A0A4R8VQJ2_9MICO|nr:MULTISPECIES: M20 family metallopeptidase [Cryobacterium]TFB85076.1 M20 family peptidase [Cryobacterium levicorallinum]TFD62446.1 M20 family peptidase [Cryobacterium sp. Hh38]